MRSAFHVLEPVSLAISAAASATAVLSDVHEISVKAAREVEDALPSYLLTASVKESTVKSLHERRNFICRPAHAAVNLLDPKYKGRCLSDEDVCYAMDYITEVTGRLGLDIGKVLSNLGDYRILSGAWSRELLDDSAKHVSPSTR